MDSRADPIAGRATWPVHPATRPSAGDRLAVWIGVLCAVGLAVLAIAVRAGPLALDDAIRSGLGVGRPVPFPLDLLNAVGGALVWDAGIAALVAVLVLAGRRGDAGWLGGSVLAGEVIASGLKLLVDRPRPPGVAVIDLVTQASFPSGHATRAAITAAILVLVWAGPSRRRVGAVVVAGALAVLFAVLMGLARIVSGEHWPTDVLGSYLVAGIVITGAAALRPRFRRREPDRPRLPVPDRPGPGRRP